MIDKPVSAEEFLKDTLLYSMPPYSAIELVRARDKQLIEAACAAVCVWCRDGIERDDSCWHAKKVPVGIAYPRGTWRGWCYAEGIRSALSSLLEPR